MNFHYSLYLLGLSTDGECLSCSNGCSKTSFWRTWNGICRWCFLKIEYKANKLKKQFYVANFYNFIGITSEIWTNIQFCHFLQAMHSGPFTDTEQIESYVLSSIKSAYMRVSCSIFSLHSFWFIQSCFFPLFLVWELGNALWSFWQV